MGCHQLGRIKKQGDRACSFPIAFEKKSYLRFMGNNSVKPSDALTNYSMETLSKLFQKAKTMKFWGLFLGMTLCLSNLGFGQLAGIKTIPGDYPSFVAAVADLNAQGAALGGVEFHIAAGYVEQNVLNVDINPLINRPSKTRPVTFKKQGLGNDPKLVSGTGTNAWTDIMIRLYGTEYVTFDGIELEENPINTNSGTWVEGGIWFYHSGTYLTGVQGCKHNTIKNCTISLHRDNHQSVGIKLTNYGLQNQYYFDKAGHSFNRFLSNTIENVAKGYYFQSFPRQSRKSASVGNRIDTDPTSGRPSTIRNLGSIYLYSCGIQLSDMDQTTIANTRIDSRGGALTTRSIFGIKIDGLHGYSTEIFNDTITIQGGYQADSVYAISYNTGVETNGGFVNIHDNLFTDCFYYGILFNGAVSKVSIKNNKINNNGSIQLLAPFNGAIRIAGVVDELDIVQNEIANNGYAGFTAIEVIPRFGYAKVSYNHLHDNHPLPFQSGDFLGISINGISNYRLNAKGELKGNRIIENGGSSSNYGIRMIGSLPSYNGEILVDSNQIHGLSGSFVYGIDLSKVGIAEISRNEISRLVGPRIEGIAIGNYGDYVIHNNFISDLDGGAGSAFDGIWGINVDGDWRLSTKIYNNTIYINSPNSVLPSNSAALRFWGTAIDHDVSGNILVNLTNPISAPGFSTTIYGVSDRILEFNPGSGSNCLYVGPTSPIKSYVKVLGGATHSQIDAYHAFMSPAEQNSFVEMPPFLNATVLPYDLHLSDTVPTSCEQGLLVRNDYGKDIDGDIRQGFPGYVLPSVGGMACDVGADEFNGLPLNGTAPRIMFEPLSTGLIGNSRILTEWAKIEDVEGVNNTPGNRPRLYYRRSNDADTLVGNSSLDLGWKYVEAVLSGGKYSFTIDYARLYGGGVVTGAVIEYFVVAQDLGIPSKVGFEKVVFANPPSAVQLAPSNFPVTGGIQSYAISGDSLSGTILVGAGQTYTSLTNTGGAFELINSSVLVGDVALKITSDLINELGEVDLVPFAAQDMHDKFYVKISPDSTVLRLVEGTDSLDGMILLNHVDRVIIDGKVNGQRGHLLIRNKDARQPAISIMNGAQDIQVSGCIVESARVPPGPFPLFRSQGLVVEQQESPVSLAERGCDRLRIDQNEFRYRSDLIPTTYSNLPAITVLGPSNDNFGHDSIQVVKNYFSNVENSGSNSSFSVVDIRSRCDEMRIDSNHFYFPQAGVGTDVDVYQFINITSGIGVKRGKLHIGNNFIGGTAPFCQGNSMPTFDITCTSFEAIRVDLLNSDIVIEENQIKNFKLNVLDFTNVSNGVRPNLALISGAAGDFDIKSNIIGGPGPNDKLKVKWNQIGQPKFAHGIVLGDSTFSGVSGLIEGNKIMNVELYDSTPGSPRVYGGWISAYSQHHDSPIIIQHNQIGDTLGIAALSVLAGRPFFSGIHAGSKSSKIIIRENLLGNLHVGGVYGNNPIMIRAGLTTGSCGDVEVIDNYLEHRGLANPPPFNGATRGGYPGGIRVISTGKENLVAGNHIRLTPRDSLGRQHGLRIFGIMIDSQGYSGGKVVGNTIEGAGMRFGQNNAYLIGINLKSGYDWTIHSNVIQLGDSGSLSPEMVVGILDSAAFGNNLIANNTIVLGTSLINTDTTVGFMKMGNSNTLLRNNLIVNAVNGIAGSPDYGLFLAMNDPEFIWNANSSNYNLLMTADSGRVAQFGYTSAVGSFPNWKANTGCDRESYFATTTTLPLDSLFVDYQASNLHINRNSQNCWYVNGKGIAGSESGYELQDIDFDTSRAIVLGVPVDIGADEFEPQIGVLPISCEASGPAVPGTTTSYSFAGRTIGEISWPQASPVPQNVDWKYYSSVPPIGSGGQDINSYWKIDFGGQTGWNSDIRYYYSVHEQAGLSDQLLNLGQRLALGPWYYIPGTIGQNLKGKYLERSGLAAIDEFTLGVQAPSAPFHITTTVAAGSGAAAPSNNVAVLPLTNQTISFQGLGCQWVDSLFIDGLYVGNPSSYTFSNITSDHQIIVKFVHALLPPVVTIAPVAGGYCPNAAIDFGATAFLGGSAPSYQWYLNGIATGSNSSLFTTNTQNGDLVTCIMTSNDSCALWPMDTSNVFVVAQTDTVSPVAICQSFQLQLDSMGNGTLTVQDIDNGSYDQCGIASTSLSQSQFDCNDLGNASVVVTITDSSGNASTCNSSINIIASPMVTTFVPVVNICGKHISCAGGQDGEASVQVSGGCSPYSYQWTSGATTAIASNLSAGIHTVTVTDAAGMTQTAQSVLVQPLPFFIQVSNVDSSCAGDTTGSIQMYLNQGNNCQPYSFLWTLPNGGGTSTQQNLSGISAGIYQFAVTDVLGCTDSINVTVGSFPNPQPVILQNGNTLSTTQIYTSYQWLFFGVPIIGGTGSTHTTSVNGDFQVEVTDQNGCIGRSTIYPLVGAQDPQESLYGLDLFPNPARGTVQLKSIIGVNGKVNIQVQNLAGQLVRSFELLNLIEPQQLDISGISAGSYFLVVTDEKQRSTILRLHIQ